MKIREYEVYGNLNIVKDTSISRKDRNIMIIYFCSLLYRFLFEDRNIYFDK